jgi:hypothetical protein
MTAMRKTMLAAIAAAIGAFASPAMAQDAYYFTDQGRTALSSYVSRIAAAIRSHLFYPPREPRVAQGALLASPSRSARPAP